MKNVPLCDFIYYQYLKYTAYICRAENTAITMKMLFVKTSKKYCRDQWIKIVDLLGVLIDQAKKLTQSKTELN